MQVAMGDLLVAIGDLLVAMGDLLVAVGDLEVGDELLKFSRSLRGEMIA